MARIYCSYFPLPASNLFLPPSSSLDPRPSTRYNREAMKGPKPQATSFTAIDPEGLAAAVRQFNTWRFWDCHETLEDIWHAEETALADFYQGLIKLAAGFHHLLRGNRRGALNLLSGGLRLLEPFRPRCLGVDVEKLVEEARRCYDQIASLGPQRLDRFDRSLIPTIAFDEEAVRAP